MSFTANEAPVFLEIIIIFQIRIIKNPIKFEMATADILIVILGIRIMFVITLMPPETAKGKIVFLERPSD